VGVELLRVDSITKVFDGGIIANQDISLTILQGEIHGIVGENGAGKSTLMKILYGMENPTSGAIYLENERLELRTSRDAIEKGIGMVHQHFMLIEELSGWENFRLGLEGKPFLIHRQDDLNELREADKKYQLNVDGSLLVRDMSVGMKQKLEILKILHRGVKLLILDEPTAVLTPQETDELFARLSDLKKQGVTIVFISHKLNEIRQICDRITILRDGRNMGTYPVGGLSNEKISELMVGREVSQTIDKPFQEPGDVVIHAENLKQADVHGVEKLVNVDITLRAGEILGIAGVDGNGQNELFNVLTGQAKDYVGQIFFEGDDVHHISINQLNKLGLSKVPADRMKDGVCKELTIWENLFSPRIKNFTSKFGALKQKKIDEEARKLINDFQIKANAPSQRVQTLSGGNIQKVVVAREFSTDVHALILNEPTRGIDVGAISFIHQRILEMREKGSAILLISSDLGELLSLSDRIIVMYKGEVVARFNHQESPVTEQELGLYMLGLKKMESMES
jgi:simple sugar transport system ATP-binding protein